MVRPACRMLTSAPDNGVPDTLSATVPLMSPSTGGAARRAAAAAGRVKPPAVARHARIVTAFAKCLALMCSPLTSTSSRGPCASGVGTGEATGRLCLGVGAARQRVVPSGESGRRPGWREESGDRAAEPHGSRGSCRPGLGDRDAQPGRAARGERRGQKVAEGAVRGVDARAGTGGVRLDVRCGVRAGGVELGVRPRGGARQRELEQRRQQPERSQDRKSTRLNSSHSQISYAVFCLKKKKK